MRFLGTSLTIALLLLPGLAHADPKDDARRHFGAGLEAAKGGNYELALQRFLAAQEAYPHPATLYNIAKSYYDLDDLENALTYYRVFSDAAPERAAEVQPIITVLEARLSQSSAPSASPTPTGVGMAAAGPTVEELARLKAIAEELQALSTVIEQRAEEQPAPEIDPGEPDTDADPEPEAVVAEIELLGEAYERVVVTASRVGQDPLDSPSTLSVLTADDIRLSGVLTIPDLLRRVVGVDVMSPAASHSDISIRGFNRKLNNKVLVLIDGRSTYLDFIGATFWASFPIQLEEIERIEVIRGPGSAVYGANAVNGVINIITRTPGQGDQVFRMDAGHPGILRASAVTTGGKEATTYRLSAGFEEHARWAKEYAINNVEGNLIANTPIEPFQLNQDRALKAMKANARIDHTFGEEGAVSLSGGISDGAFEFYNIGALPNYGNELTSTYLRGDAFWGVAHLRAFWNKNYGRTGPWIEQAGASRNQNANFDNDAVDIELEAPLSFETGAAEHQLTVGGGYRYKRIAFGYLEGGFSSPYNEHHFKAFVNDQMTIDKLSLVGALRLDRHPLLPINKTLSPRAAVIYRAAEKTSVRATAGTAFRAPNSTESYLGFNLNTPAPGVFLRDNGNLELDPERITTFELGIHDESTFYHQADAVLYVNRVTDLIYLSDAEREISFFNPVGNGIQVGETGFVNLDPQYLGLGLEADVEVYPTDGLDIFANINLSRITETSNGETVVDGTTSAIKANTGVAYRTPYRTDISLMGHFVSDQLWRLREFDSETLELYVAEAPVPARFLLSARLAARPFSDENFEIAGTAWNFTELFSDGAIEHPKGQPVGGRLYGTVRYDF